MRAGAGAGEPQEALGPPTWARPCNWAQVHSRPNPKKCQDLGDSILLLLGSVILLNVGMNAVILVREITSIPFWRHLKASLRILFHHFWEKYQQQCHLNCICGTMDPKSLSPRGSPHTHQQQTCLMDPSHSLEWAPDTDDEKVSQCRWLPPQCGHSGDPMISHGPRRQGKGLVPKAGKFSHSQSAGVSTTPLLRPETLFYPGQKPQSSRNSKDSGSQSARDIQKPCQVFLSPFPVPHPEAGHVVYDARKMKGSNSQVGEFLEALSLSTGGGSLPELSKKGQNLIPQNLERPSDLPTCPADHPVEHTEYREQKATFSEGRKKSPKPHIDKRYSEKRILLLPDSASLQPSDYPTFPCHTSTPFQLLCPSEIPLLNWTPLQQQQPSKILVQSLEVSKGEIACDKQKLPKVSTLTQTHCSQGWNQNWVYKTLEMPIPNQPSLYQMPLSKGSGLATGHVVFDARQLRLNKEHARDCFPRASYDPKTPLTVSGKGRRKTGNTSP